MKMLEFLKPSLVGILLFLNTSYSLKIKSVSVGTGLSLELWQGEAPFSWKYKNQYPTPAKTLFGTSISTKIQLNSILYADFGLPLFYNRVLAYKTMDQFGTEYKANAFSIGVGDVSIATNLFWNRYHIKFQLQIPGFYDPNSDISDISDNSGGVGNNTSPIVMRVSSWTGMGVYRLISSIGIKARYPFGSAKWNIQTGLDWAIGDFDGKGLVEPHDKKIKISGVHSQKINENVGFKIGVNSDYSRYHWYGVANDPRTQIVIEPFFGFDFKSTGGKSISLSGGFTAYNWVRDDFLPMGSKKIFLGIGFNKYL